MILVKHFQEQLLCLCIYHRCIIFKMWDYMDQTLREMRVVREEKVKILSTYAC